MKFKVVTVDLEIPRNIKQWALRLSIPVIGIGFAAMAYAAATPLHVWAKDDVLQAQDLNDSLTSLQSQITALQGAGAPSGSILAYAGPTCPTGTVLADGASVQRTGVYAKLFSVIGTAYGSTNAASFNLPNAQGVFLRGAGTQTVSGVSYTGTLGAAQGDQLQGHLHTTNLNLLYYVGTGGVGLSNGGPNWQADGPKSTGGPVTDGSDGVPRVGLETRPANISVVYCIWF